MIFTKNGRNTKKAAAAILCFLLTLLSSACAQTQVVVGAARFDKYKKLLKNKRVALAANATSIIPNADINAEGGAVHDLDFLLSQKINVVKVFAPEHGFRGKGEAGETIANDVDQKTGVPIYSIYGKSLRPSPELLADVDVFVYDIQDVDKNVNVRQ